MERDAYFDNIKGILILFVVLGHLLETFYFDNKVIEYFYILIYTFNMGAFVFLSGLFFLPNLKKAFYFLEIFLIFQGLKLGLNYWLFDKSINFTSFLYPTWTLWYLLSMFFWYIISYLNQKIKISVLAIFIISLLVGFIPKVNTLLSFQRTFSYLGFFSLGVFINYKNFKNILRKLNIKPIYIYISFILSNIIYCSKKFNFTNKFIL